MLEYELIDNASAYMVLNETDNTVSKLTIPDEYNGKPVTAVSAMLTGFDNLKEVYVGNNVVQTGYGFLESSSIEKIYFGRSILSVTGPFTELTGLTDIYYSGTKEDWEKIVFNVIDDTDSLENIQNAEMHYGVLAQGALLKLGENTIFPYTHWDCVHGKPDTTEADKISYSNEISGLNATTVKEAIDELNAKHFDASSINSWSELQHLVRSGRAKDFLSIGDQLVSQKDGVDLVWNVIGIDEDIPADTAFSHSLTLQLNECYNLYPFAKIEASYVNFIPLEAGQYYIGLKYAQKSPVYYSFTLDEELPTGHRIRICDGTVYLHASKNESEYKTFAVDMQSTNKEDMSGTELTEANYFINSTMGTNNYLKSYVRAWLNSKDEEVTQPENIYELTYDKTYSLPGFENGMDEEFLNALGEVKKTATLPTGEIAEVNDKFFLLSVKEIYGSAGNAYSYYKENSSLESASKLADPIRIKNYSGKAKSWWLRDPYVDDGLMRVQSNGSISALIANATSVYGIVPACCVC